MSNPLADGCYTVRSTRDGGAGHVTYELVDEAGALVNVTIPRALSTDELSHSVLRTALTSRVETHKPMR